MKISKHFPKRSIGSILLLSALGVSTWQGWQWWMWASAAPVVSGTESTQTVKLKIPSGTSAQEIGKDLEAIGLIRSSTAWNFWVRWLMLKEPKGGFKAGTYELLRSESMQMIATKIWAGKEVQLGFTIPEGWNLQQMAKYFEQQGFFSAQEFLSAAEKMSLAEYPWLSANSISGSVRLEGFLYPDTYNVSPNVTPQEVLRQMLTRFEQVALPLYQQAKGQTRLSLPQWVTLASIVEREAVVSSERPLIAGVFMNRLQQGMPLGSDPTVEYVLGIQQTPDRTLTLTEVNTPSPYNTYLNPGLPPTPIASPGLASLNATLRPQKTDYLYFVARYDGTHVFTRTLADHQTAQTKIHDKREVNKTGQSPTPVLSPAPKR